MSRPHAAAQPSTTVAAQPNVIVAAPVRYAHTNADAPTPRLNPIRIPFAGPFPPHGTPPLAPYPAPFYPMGPPPAFPHVMPPGAFPGPPVYPSPPPPPGVLGPYPGTPVLPTVDPKYITQYPVCQGPPGFPPSLIYPPPGVFSYQGPASVHGIVDPVTMARPPVPPVAPPDIPNFKIYIGKIAPTVDNDFVLSLLQVCGVVKSWEPVTNPITRTGFGFCEFESAEGSLRARRLLNKLSVDGQELVLNVNQATRDYFQKAKEAESERDGVVSLADNGNDLSRAIPDVTARGAVGGQMSTKGETKRCQNGTGEYSEADKDAMQRIHSMIEERMKSKLLGSPTPAVQVSACIVDDNGNDDAQSSGEERKIRRQCEKEEHLGERKAVCSEGQKGREVTAAGKSSLRIDEPPSMHVPMEREFIVEHKRRSQHRERDGYRKSNGEEKGRERKAVGSEGQKDREVTAARVSSLQIDEALSMHVHMECESTVEHERKRDGFHKSNGEERVIVFVPGLVSDKQNISAKGKVGFELRATSKSGDKRTLDAKQLLATVPKMKEELFSHDVNWAIYDAHGLHERMMPWISKKATEVFGEELAEFVDYVIASIKEVPSRLLELMDNLKEVGAAHLLFWTPLLVEQSICAPCAFVLLIIVNHDTKCHCVSSFQMYLSRCRIVMQCWR